MRRDEEQRAVLEALALLWARHPEQRLTQLILNINRSPNTGRLPTPGFLWNVLDADLLVRTQNVPWDQSTGTPPEETA